MEAELQLVDKVEFRITLASSDEKFQQNLSVFLAPLILKLSSTFTEVRTKVLKFLGHLIIRINSSNVKLPIEKLLDQAKAPTGFNGVSNVTAFNQVKLYSYLFVAKGLEKENDDSTLLSYIPHIISCIDTQIKVVSKKMEDSVLSRSFNILILILSKVSDKSLNELQSSTIFKNPTNYTKEYLKLQDHQSALEFILNLFGKIYLLLPKPSNQNQTTPLKFYHCPGLTNDEVQFFTYNAGMSFSFQILSSLKFKILIFLQLIDFEVITSREAICYQYILLLFANHDSSSTINSKANNLFKRLPDINRNPKIDENSLLNTANDYFLGSEFSQPVPIVLQEAIISSIFRKSSKIIEFNDKYLIEICTKGLQAGCSGSSNIHLKLKKSSLLFVKYIVNHSKYSKTTFVEKLAAEIMNAINNDGWPKMSNSNMPAMKISIFKEIRRLQYETLSDLIIKDSSLLVQTGPDELEYFKFFFNSLKGEDEDNISIVQDSLGKLINKFSITFYSIPDQILKKDLGDKLKAFFKDILARDTDSTITDADGDVEMINVIHKGVPNSTSSFRYLALKFVNALFEYDDCEARFLNIYGSYKLNRFDVIEASSKGLNPFWFNLNKSSLNISSKNQMKENVTTKELLGVNNVNNLKFPRFVDLVSQFQKELEFLHKYPNSGILIDILPSIFEYLLKVMIMESIEKLKTSIITLDEDWDFRTMKALELDVKVRQHFVNYLKNNNENSLLSFYLQAILDCFVSKGNLVDNEQFSKVGEVLINNGDQPINISLFNQVYKGIQTFGPILNTIISLSDSILLSKLSYYSEKKFNLLWNLINLEIVDLKKQKYNKTYYARLIQEGAILSLAKAISIFMFVDSQNDYLIRLLEPFNNEEIYGTDNDFYTCRIVFFANILGRLNLKLRISETFGIENLEKFLLKYHEIMKYNISTKNWKHYEALLNGIVELSKYGALNIESESIKNLVDNIKDLIKPRVIKCDEKSVFAWGCLSFVSTSELNADDDDNLLASIDKDIKLVYDTHISKQTEYLFSCGEVISIFSCGWESKVLTKLIDIQGYEISQIKKLVRSPPDHQLSKILTIVLKGCAATKPSLRKSSCIWLLSLLQYCGHLPIIVEKSREIHVAFMKFLADNDELVQESASTGLGLVYEMGDPDLKESLMKGLMKSFTNSTNSSKLTAGIISEETELFEPGVLNTSDGSISTYKDILNLATDMGDPSLVYKFMALTKSSSLWASRKGIAFGLSNIMSKANLEQMLQSNDDLARRLVVKLYRYRFDPNENVSRSMNDIWNILVPNSSQVIELNSDLILQELLSSVEKREWRTRQAGCIAMIDFLQILPVEKYELSFEKIWIMAFRAIDDIKDSVRDSGTKLTKYLSNNLINSIENIHTSKAKSYQNILKTLIPFLTGTKGILSSVNEVQSFSLDIILKLAKKAGDSLKPFIPGLIEELLVLMSTLEPQIVNYLALNADKYNMKVSDIDAKRLTSVGHSPMMEAIERMLDYVTDDDLVNEVILRLNSAVKRSVGLPSKVACSRVIVTLVVKHLQIVKEKHASSLIKTCIGQLNNRNETVAIAYTYSAGHLCRVAKTASILKYGRYLKDLYFKYQSEQDRKISANGCESIAKYSNDKFNSVASFFLPLAFVCQNDPEKEIGKVFKNVWTENTGGNSAVKLYIDEISSIASENLQSPQYLIKQVCAKSIAEACTLMSSSSIDGKIIGLSDSTIQSLFEILIEASKGRSWKGKEVVLNALVTFFNSFENNSIWYDKIYSIIFSAAKKYNKEQLKIINSLANFISSVPNVELYEEEIKIISPFFQDSFYEKNDSSDESESDDEDSHTKKKVKTDTIQHSKSSVINLQREEILISLISSLCLSFGINEKNPKLPTNLLIFLINETLPRVFHMSQMTPTWRIKIAFTENFGLLLDRLIEFNEKIKTNRELFIDENLLNELYTNLKIHFLIESEIQNVKVSTIRIIAKIMKVTNNDELIEKIKFEISQWYNNEDSGVIKVELENILDIKN